MKSRKSLGLILAVLGLLFANHAFAGMSPIYTQQFSIASFQKNVEGIQLAHNTGYPHYHGHYPRRTRYRTRPTYRDCSRAVFQPCRKAGGTYRYCNRQHHLCRYGHLGNCIRGETC